MLKTVAVDGDALRAVCEALTPSCDHACLTRAVAHAVGGDARLALVGSRWYRTGGLVDAQGRSIAEDLEAWAQAECGGDIVELYARYADSEYYVTASHGSTLYLTVPVGDGPLDFIQVEVDEVQETLERRLFVGDDIPDVIDQLFEPNGDSRPLSPMRYKLRAISDFTDLAETIVGEHKGDPRFRRFVEEWLQSSAGRRRFCDHWVLSLVPYLDEDGEHLMEARPLPVATPPFPDLSQQRTRQIDYHPSRDVRAIDCQAGYPMAWYFLQITQHYAPYRCMVDVRDDFSAGGCGEMLPSCDMRLIDNWVEVPYNFH